MDSPRQFSSKTRHRGCATSAKPALLCGPQQCGYNCIVASCAYYAHAPALGTPDVYYEYVSRAATDAVLVGGGDYIILRWWCRDNAPGSSHPSQTKAR